MFRRITIVLLAAAVFMGHIARADEPTRQVQEELRMRHLFYGDIDGRTSAPFSAALKRYQARKGFTQTGVTDADTLKSLGVSGPAAPSQLPDVPILRSDRSVPEGVEGGGPSFVPLPPSIVAPLPTRAEMSTYLRRYLDATQTPNVNDALAFYGDQVQYYDHGTVNRGYIRNELVVYQQHWPEQKYVIVGPVTVRKSGDKITGRARVSFELANATLGRKAAGQTDSIWLLAQQADRSWKIVGLQETRVRRGWHRRPIVNPVAVTARKLQRSVQKLFH